MKKSLAILGIITCMVGLTACGAKAEPTPFMPEEQAIEVGINTVESLKQIVDQGAEEQYKGDAVIEAALTSWKNAQEELGDYVGISEAETTATISEDEAVVNVMVKGTDHNATVEVILDETYYTSITTNVIKTFGEMMTNAALNTLIGMGTVFVVLILISVIISLFGLIPKIQDSFKKKETVQEKAVDNAVAQIIEQEELSDDLELVAVIAAAIAASEGAASTDGFVVRSIRKVNRR